MSRIAAAHSENALASLRTLLEVNTQMAREDPERRLDGSASDEVRDVMAEVLASSADHRDVLAGLVVDWEAHVRRSGSVLKPTFEARLSPRELVESWLAIKEASVDLLSRAAGNAPTASIRRRLEDLARDEAAHTERLRALL